MTEQEIQAWKTTIDGMSQLECANLRRFAPSGHPVFDSHYPLYDYFERHFQAIGGMTPSVSKAIGWER